MRNKIRFINGNVYMPPRKSTHVYRILAILALAVLLFSFSIPQEASADISPHPTMRFTWDFTNVDSTPQIAFVHLYYCDDDPSCSEPELIEDLAAQQVTWDESGCYAMLYNHEGYWQLEAGLPDQVLRSEPFENIDFDSSYNVVFHSSRLDVHRIAPQPAAQVEPEQSFAPSVLPVKLNATAIALVTTLVIELIVACVYLSKRSLPKKLLWLVVMGNIITIPLVWLVIPVIVLPRAFTVAFQIATAIVIEAVIFRIGASRLLGWWRGFELSVWTNMTSYVLGLFIVVVIQQIG
jgi:hypothetical protein